MTITLRPEQEAWLKDAVAIGEFASVEDAARHLIDERIAERELERSDDLAWAKPAVGEGILARDRGNVITLAEHKVRNTARLAALKG